MVGTCFKQILKERITRDLWELKPNIFKVWIFKFSILGLLFIEIWNLQWHYCEPLQPCEILFHMWWESWRTNRFARAEHIYDSSRKNGSNQFLAHSPSVASYTSAPKFDSIAKLSQQGYKWTESLITKIPGSSSPEAQQRMQRPKENGNWDTVFSVNKGWCQDLLVWSGGSQHCYCLCNTFPRITQEISVSKRVCLISFSSSHVFCKKNPTNPSAPC